MEWSYIYSEASMVDVGSWYGPRVCALGLVMIHEIGRSVIIVFGNCLWHCSIKLPLQHWWQINGEGLWESVKWDFLQNRNIFINEIYFKICTFLPWGWCVILKFRADSRLAPSQWETALQSNAVSHWRGGNLASALMLLTSFLHWCSGLILGLCEPMRYIVTK